MSPRYEYIRDPEEIYRRSFAIVREEAGLEQLSVDMARVAERLVHACGMPDIAAALRFTPDLPNAGRTALVGGAPILADSRMVAEGVIRERLPAGNEVLCTTGDPGIADLAARLETTRSAAAVEHWRDHLGGSVVAIGNAPTALFRLLEILAEAGQDKPAAILAFPVGFVGAAESKDALIEAGLGVPYITLPGRRGGSPLAAAAVNALAELAR
jgi:precorrin-8X/cobalt-precorrin-8 methylmutase